MNVSATQFSRGSDTRLRESTRIYSQSVVSSLTQPVRNWSSCNSARYYTWLEAMDKAGVERHLFPEVGGSLLKAAWNRVRLNGGTVEMRGTDSIILRLSSRSLLWFIMQRTGSDENLTVRPAEGVRTFELSGNKLSCRTKYLDRNPLCCRY